MKVFYAVILGSISLFAFNNPALADKDYETQIIKQPEQKWYFRNVSTYPTKEGVVVSGRMTSEAVNLPSGHIDIAVFDSAGSFLYETTTDYTPATLNHHAKRNGGVHFYTTLEKTPPKGSVVKVAFHAEEYQEKHPEHTKNIARGN